MNIFVTSKFPAESAICLPDKHVAGYVHTHPQVYLEDANETRFDRVADHNAADYYTAVEKLLNE